MNPGMLADNARFDRRAWARLLVLCTAILFEGMSMSSINVQMPSIQRTFEVSPGQLQLVASSFLAAYAGLLMLGGKCADHWGHRRMFLTGVAIFSAGSLAAALSQGTISLIAARGVQGAGAAATAPAAIALVIDGFQEGAARNRALGVFSAMGAAGFSLGVVAAGLLTEEDGWRAGFLIYVPIGLLVLVVGARVLDRATSAVARQDRIPWIAGILVTGGLVGVIWAGGMIGTGSPAEVAVVGGAGLAAIAAFLVLQVKQQSPLLPFSLLADRRLIAAGLALGGAFAGIMGAMFLVANDLQDQDGYSALAAGLAFLPQGLAVGLLSAPAARLVNRRPARQLLIGGLAVITAGQLLYTTSERGGYAAHLLPAALLVGAGIAAAYPAAVMLASTAASADDRGTASGFLVTCQQAGGAIGVASVTGIQNSAHGYLWNGPYGLWGCACFAAAALLGCSLLLARGQQRDTAAAPSEDTAAIR